MTPLIADEAVSGIVIDLSRGSTWIVLLVLVAAGIYVWRHYRAKLLDAIPDPIENLLRTLGVNIGNYLQKDGTVVADSDLPMIAAMDNAVKTLLVKGMIEDAGVQEQLRYKLMVKMFSPQSQSPSAIPNSPAIDLDALADKVASKIAKPAGGAA